MIENVPNHGSGASRFECWRGGGPDLGRALGLSRHDAGDEKEGNEDARHGGQV